MPDDLRAWIVMLRDISSAVRVEGTPVLMASLVLDAETGLALGSSVASDGPGALAQALETALTKPVGPLQAGRPDLILCTEGLAPRIDAALAALRPGEAVPSIRAAEAVPDAEDVFDSLLGHLSGRAQPADTPGSEDWRVAFEVALGYWQQAPWERWNDTVHLHLQLELSAPDNPATYLGVVLGAEGIQRGLVLYPGTVLPAGLGDWEPGSPVPVPSGTLMFFLDPPSELPAELVTKATRYGWTTDAEVVPAFIRKGPDGPLDVSRRDVQHLSLAAAAVVAHDQRGPIVVGTRSDTTGELDLAGGQRARFSLAVSTGRADQDADVEVRCDKIADEALGGNATIDALFDAFLTSQRNRLAARTWRNYETVIGLLRDCLNSYGHQSLDATERRRWEAAYDHDEDAFVRLFGADKIAENLGEFLGYFMIRKVAAGEELLRSAGTVTKKLVGWLADGGHLDTADARDAGERAAEAARDLPRAEKLSRLLYEHACRSSIDTESLGDDDYIEDYLTINRVEPGLLWFEGGVGPVKVPRAASALAQAGWSVSVSLGRSRGQWQVVEVGNVYP
ncbi:MAG: hypothetical protein M3063_00730 [Actinomycetota bacterium]|nr:hypothetical protein [Actinomycetota bacterium]